MLSFDSRAAQDRIERLPWVERASIERVLPDRLEVRVSERSPSAVWRLGDRNFLIDKSGRVLAAVPRDAMPSLPRVAGEGAATEAAGLYALLAGHPALMARVERRRARRRAPMDAAARRRRHRAAAGHGRGGGARPRAARCRRTRAPR